MATPAASPQVASTVGLKNVVIAPLVTDTDEGHSYGELQLLKHPSRPKMLIPTSSMRMTWNSTLCIPIRN